MATSQLYEPTLQWFYNNFLLFLQKEHPELLKDKVEFMRDGEPFRMRYHMHSRITQVPIIGSKTTFDLYFAGEISYRYQEVMGEHDWDHLVTNEPSILYTKFYRGIFREYIKHPYREVIKTMKKEGLNFICLRAYRGDTTEYNFARHLRSEGIAILFMKKNI